MTSCYLAHFDQVPLPEDIEYQFCHHKVAATASSYVGDPKSGHVQILNGRLCLVLEWCPDFEWFI